MKYLPTVTRLPFVRRTCIAFLVLCSGPAVKAQLVPDGTTQIVNGTNISLGVSSVTVGSNEPNTVLILTNGGTVFDGGASIGANIGSSSNGVVVTGANSAWNNGGNLLVGNSGSFNTLAITAGGLVTNTFGYVGYNSSASNNQAIVSGPGSLWNNRGQFFVGYNGSFNSMVISNGGMVSNSVGYVGFTGAGNQVTVSGTDSMWLNSGDLNVGYLGSFNTLIIANGGTVTNEFGNIGQNASATSNQVIVSGANSAWNSHGYLSVGYSGPANSLLISNAGTVNAQQVTLGFNPASVGNRLTIDGGNLRVVNGDTAELDIRRGTNVFNSGLIDTDKLIMSSTQGFFDFNGGTLITRGATINNNQSFIVGRGPGFGPATWDVRSNAGPTVVNDSLTIGFDTTNATLLITNGAQLNGSSGIIGGSVNASNNRAIINGINSAWNNDGNVTIGLQGSFNTLSITNGGTVRAANINVGSAGSSNNRLALGNGTLLLTGGLAVSSNNFISGTGTIHGNVTNSGTLSPGNSAGSLTINGSLTFASSAQVSFELGGLIATNQYDQINVTNFVQFAGTFSLALINGFTPTAGNSFTLMNFASYTGTFANATNGAVLFTADQQRRFTVTYTATNLVVGNFQSALTLTSVAPAPGQVIVRFQSVAGNSYQMQYSSTLTNWTDATSPPITNAITGVTAWVDGGTNTGGSVPPMRFYRVRFWP